MKSKHSSTKTYDSDYEKLCSLKKKLHGIKESADKKVQSIKSILIKIKGEFAKIENLTLGVHNASLQTVIKSL